MDNFIQGLPHMVIACLVIAAAVVLSTLGQISGGEAVGMILGAAGFTMGGTVASGSISTAATAAASVSGSTSAPATAATIPSPTSQQVTPIVAAQ